MPMDLRRAFWLIVPLTLATCKAPPPPVQQAQFVPAPTTKPSDRPPICAHPEEVNASHVVGLQTQLMQIALSCGGEDKYDTFVRKFQPQLKEQRDVLGSFFMRAYGRVEYQTAYDQYVTQLADAESNYNLASGADFCPLSKPTLDQAITLSSDDDLAKFVAKVPVQQATDFETCGTPGAPPAVAIPVRETRHVRYRRIRHHHHTD
jgi:hypothetical protein